MSFRSCFGLIYKYVLIVLLSCFAMVTTASIAEAQNYDAAKKIMEADKQVKDYQAAKAGGYGYIYDDQTAGANILSIVLLIVLIGGGGLWLSGSVSDSLIKRRAQAKRDHLNRYVVIKDKLIEDLTPTKYKELEVGETFFFKHAGGGYADDLPQDKCLAVTIDRQRCAFIKKGTHRNTIGSTIVGPLTDVVRVRLPAEE